MIEEWRPAVRYESYYEVSNFGRVRRICGGRGATKGRVLSQNQQGEDYLSVQLCRRDQKRKIGVHILVAEAFHGPRPRGKFPNHKDLNRRNNLAENLEWLTRKQNAQHALTAGRVGGRPLPGEQNGRCKLSLSQVTEIRAQKGKLGQRTLARLCGVSKTAIQLIHQGKHWPEDLRVREFPVASNAGQSSAALPQLSGASKSSIQTKKEKESLGSKAGGKSGSEKCAGRDCK